jgi:hypothetical protein
VTENLDISLTKVRKREIFLKFVCLINIDVSAKDGVKTKTMEKAILRSYSSFTSNNFEVDEVSLFPFSQNDLKTYIYSLIK